MILNNSTITEHVHADNIRQLAFVLAYFNYTYSVYMSVLETRESEAIPFFRCTQFSCVCWLDLLREDLSLQKLSKYRPQKLWHKLL